MQVFPIVLNQYETRELLKISALREESLSLDQWELLGRLVGSVLMQIQNEFINQDDFTGFELRVTPVASLCSAEKLSDAVPFFSHRM